MKLLGIKEFNSELDDRYKPANTAPSVGKLCFLTANMPYMAINLHVVFMSLYGIITIGSVSTEI